MKRLVLAWAATAVAATGAAVAVLALLGTGLTGDSGHVLSPAEVRAALNTATHRATGTPSDDATPTPGTPTQAVQDKLLRTPGGTVIASCEGDLVTLRSWSPAQNYSVDHVEPGPARRAKVEFEPEEGVDVELEIECSGGRPVTSFGS
ncbi:hypothetical protein ACFPOI_12475 [Nonomuraea angiospora]|uniref:Serine/threonine-protein kinase n=1 Tax=Nonomuraea angiospora TaxID=46172 RepID=A0ABR9MFC5_9ACTN|nr:hypothetical protein [Nonomuraea angiospora]MBE1591345.1 serine/threonine-protein kinase [Nonomuraea angiospora]